MITRDVEPSAVADLALSPRRTTLAVTVDDDVRVLPVSVRLDKPADPARSPRIIQAPVGSPNLGDRNVVVVADDGPQWFRLRSLTIRGTAETMGDRTYRVIPERIVAWDYGSLREASVSPAAATRRQGPTPVADGGDDLQPCRSPNIQAAVGNSYVMVLASRSPRGTPFAVPLWFVAHRGRWYATTSASSWSVRNVDASPRVAVLLGGEDGQSANRLVVRGHARAVRGIPPLAALAEITWRYYLQPQFAAVELSHIRLWARRMRYYGQSRPAYIVITPLAAIECEAPQSP